MSAQLTSLVSTAIAKELPNAIKAAHVLLTDSAKNALITTEKNNGQHISTMIHMQNLQKMAE